MAELHVLHAEPLSSDAVRVLENMLERARAGEMSSVAIAYVDREGCCGSMHSAAPSRGLLVGAIESLKYRVMEAWQ